MAHVAAAHEDRGRVVLRLSSSTPHRMAVEAALRVARAYQASLESVYIEDQRLLDLSAHDGAAELSFSGRNRRSISAATFLWQFAYAAREAERRIAAMARLAEIPYAARTMRDTPSHALGRACAEKGPWNVVALAEPFCARDRDGLMQLIHEVDGVTGYVLVAPAVRRAHGPIVVVVEDAARLAQLMRIADRLGAHTREPVSVLISASAGELEHIEQAARLLLADRLDVSLQIAATYGDTAALADTLRRMRGGFVVGEAGQSLLPFDRSWQALVQSLECPLFIAR
jgi:hypothetical protein